MIPFLVVFFILAVFAFVDISDFTGREKNWLWGGLVVLLSLFAGLRYNSPDYRNYRFMFETLADPHIVHADVVGVASDPGYLLLNKIVASFTSSYWVLFLVVAALSVCVNLSSYKKYTPYVFTAILFYFVHTYVGREMMQIRAGLACAVCLYSVRFIIDRKKWHFLAAVLVAASFHLVAICFLGSYVLCRVDIPYKVWKYILVGCIAVGCLYPLGRVIKMIPAMEMLERVQTYNSWDEYNGDLGVFTNPTVLKELFVLGICMRFSGALSRFRGFKVFFDLYAFSLCWLILFHDYSIFAARIATLFSITEVILCSYFYGFVAPRSRVACCCGLILFAFLILGLNLYTDRFFDYRLIPELHSL